MCNVHKLMYGPNEIRKVSHSSCEHTNEHVDLDYEIIGSLPSFVLFRIYLHFVCIFCSSSIRKAYSEQRVNYISLYEWIIACNSKWKDLFPYIWIVLFLSLFLSLSFSLSPMNPISEYMSITFVQITAVPSP